MHPTDASATGHLATANHRLDSDRSGSSLLLIYGLFAAGGAAALVYEVMWMRGLRLVFGSAIDSAAVVLATLFGGMALGNLLGARLVNSTNPVRVYGWREIAVGLSAVLALFWLQLFQLVYPWGYDPLRGHPWLLTAGKFLLAPMALLPPTIAMGATLPVLAAVAPYPEPPLMPLTSLAELRQCAADLPQAIELLERAVERSPQSPSIRKRLVDLLTRSEKFDRAESHLV